MSSLFERRLVERTLPNNQFATADPRTCHHTTTSASGDAPQCREALRRGDGSYQSCLPISSIAQIQPASKKARVAPRLSRAHWNSSSFVADFGNPGIIKVFNQSAQTRRRSCASRKRLLSTVVRNGSLAHFDAARGRPPQHQCRDELTEHRMAGRQHELVPDGPPAHALGRGTG